MADSPKARLEYAAERLRKIMKKDGVQPFATDEVEGLCHLLDSLGTEYTDGLEKARRQVGALNTKVSALGRQINELREARDGAVEDLDVLTAALDREQARVRELERLLNGEITVVRSGARAAIGEGHKFHCATCEGGSREDREPEAG